MAPEPLKLPLIDRGGFGILDHEDVLVVILLGGPCLVIAPRDHDPPSVIITL